MAQCARELPRGHYGVRSTECRAKAPASAIHPHTKYEADVPRKPAIMQQVGGEGRGQSNGVLVRTVRGAIVMAWIFPLPHSVLRTKYVHVNPLPLYARFRGHATASKPYHADDATGKGGSVRMSPPYQNHNPNPSDLRRASPFLRYSCGPYISHSEGRAGTTASYSVQTTCLTNPMIRRTDHWPGSCSVSPNASLARRDRL
ncbi:hypothetical protein V8C44DRAFT_271975 [Trichoderma aethiopicum]